MICMLKKPLKIHNGDYYEGEFADDMKNGEGVYVWVDGDRYEGGYVNNKRNGFGTYTFADGTVQSGKWIEDEFIG